MYLVDNTGLRLMPKIRMNIKPEKKLSKLWYPHSTRKVRSAKKPTPKQTSKPTKTIRKAKHSEEKRYILEISLYHPYSFYILKFGK